MCVCVFSRCTTRRLLCKRGVPFVRPEEKNLHSGNITARLVVATLRHTMDGGGFESPKDFFFFFLSRHARCSPLLLPFAKEVPSSPRPVPYLWATASTPYHNSLEASSAYAPPNRPANPDKMMMYCLHARAICSRVFYLRIVGVFSTLSLIERN